MRRCTRCVLPETCPKIEFDENGLCNVCKDFDEGWSRFNLDKALRKGELDRTFDFYRHKGGKYDCLVPISGGLDSIYVLYICKKVYNLRTLAFNFNNGFQSEIAKQNIHNAVKKLNVDFITSGPSWKTAKKLYALFFRKTGEFCTPCNLGIWSMSHKVAQDYGIPLIVSGSSNRIADRLPKGGRIYQWSTSYFKEVIRGEVPFKEVEEYLHLPQNFHNSTLRSLSQRVFPSQKIQIVPLPDYLDWNEHAILNTLKSELSWRQRADRYHHIDCIMESVNDHFKQKKWGFSAAMRYSMLVRTGQITRDEALKLTTREEKKNSQEPPELKLWLKLLNLSNKDLEGFQKRSQHHYISLQERLQNATDKMLRKVLTNL
ncbi:MAG: N-acetyl sugar amidotransferase [Candidatus Bathyarchaeota archaeon]|nr:N-acetyl sugar amidotransferase [Candidatus Bathyarchaeota archaeon]MDH5595123.1 N-acetyl sugar amidotransferase [Candidatus Bathyarchaeota archaeon]